MGKKRLWILVAAACTALAAAGIATAHRGAPAVQSTSATFDATTVSQQYQVTCSVTGGDTFEATRATYTGTASSADPRLAGDLTIRAWSLVDTSNGVGHVYGIFRIKGTSTAARGTLNAALSDGNASGLAKGFVRGPWGRLVASFGGTFDPSVGFSDSLGSATTGAGFIRSGRWCHPPNWPTS
ncbi:MAG TPA: hypothetical protein VKR79_00990 [Gaiellaceae bacterium]|nr:hypothetical protein [Gaiellaceae bacterium]